MHKFYIILVFLLLISCDGGKISVNKHENVRNAAIIELPYVKEIKNNFDSVIFVANFGDYQAQQELHCVFYMQGWVECTLAQKISVTRNEVKQVGESLLYIREVTSLSKTTKGQTLKSYGHQTILKDIQIREFIDSKYDLVQLGFKKRDDVPPEEMIKSWHKRHPQ